MKRLLFILGSFLLAYFMGAYSVNAEQPVPDPQSSFKWESNPDQTVTLFYFEKGAVVAYTYQLVHEAEPATGCVRSFGRHTFSLISISEMVPFKYTIRNTPILKKEWDSEVFTPLE